jgi:hypothetical protein
MESNKLLQFSICIKFTNFNKIDILNTLIIKRDINKIPKSEIK